MANRSLLISSAAAIALGASPAFAQERSTDSDIVVVVATRTETRLSDTPAPVDVVTSSDFADRQAIDFKDVLERLPNVDFYGGPRPSGEMPSVRGATGRQLIILVDGARQSAAPGLATPLYFEPAFLGRAEVLKGSSSVLYGPGAIGGVIAFSTLEARDMLVASDEVGGDVRVDHHSASETYRGVGRIYAASDPFDVIAGASHRQWGEIRQGGGATLRPSDGHATALFVKGGWRMSDTLRLSLAHEFYDTEDFRPNNPQADNTFPFMQNNWARQNQTILNLAGFERGDVRNMSVSIYRTELESGADKNTTVTPILNENSSVLETIGGSATRTFGFATGPLNHTLTLGGDIYRDDYAGLSNGLPDTVSPNGKQTVSGVFLRDDIAIASWLSIIPAVRFDQFETSVASGVAPDSSDEATSPQLTVAVRPLDGLMLYASYGEAFRAPSVAEMFQSLTSPTAFANFRPNPSLAPEDANDINIGGAWTTDALIPGATLQIRGAYFDQDVENLIVQTVIGTYVHPVLGVRPIQQNQNVSEAKREGFEVEALVDFGALTLQGAYGQIRTTDANTGANLFSPPDKWTIDVGYELSPEIDLRWQSVWVEAQDYDSSVVRRRPDYNVHDAFLTWRPSSGVWRIDLGVTNVFDEQYLVYKQSTAYPTTYEQGRSFRIGLGTQF
jgi:hemoglobin/transferrin/lactoferrin receptor protein